MTNRALFDQVEDRISDTVSRGIEAADAAAQRDAADAYMTRFAPLCGPSFGAIVNDALCEASAKIKAAARELGVRQVTKALLDKLMTEGVK